MPASEYFEWQAHFSIYPFTFERDDMRHAELLAMITNDGNATRAQAAAKKTFTAVSPADYLPDYLGLKKKISTAAKSLEQQEAEFAAFAQRFKAATGKI